MNEEAGQNLTHHTTEYQTTSRNALNIRQLQQSNITLLLLIMKSPPNFCRYEI